MVFQNVSSRDTDEGNSTIFAAYPIFKSSCLFFHISKPFSSVTLPCSKYIISMVPVPILNYFKIRSGKKKTKPMLSNYSMPHYLKEFTVWNLFYIGNGRRYINVLWTEQVTKGNGAWNVKEWARRLTDKIFHPSSSFFSDQNLFLSYKVVCLFSHLIIISAYYFQLQRSVGYDPDHPGNSCFAVGTDM